MNLLKAASTVSLLTLVSRVTGLVREQIMAATFGASAVTDAFNVAFRIPNLLRRLFAEGAFSQAFVPMLAQVRQSRGDGPTRELVDAVATLLCWALQYNKTGNVFHRWLELREEDRWWLFNMGIADDAWKRAAGQGVAGV